MEEAGRLDVHHAEEDGGLGAAGRSEDALSDWNPHHPQAEAFRKAFPGEEPSYLVRAPGRVNLMGDHTDYNGLPVLPMALAQDIRILFSPRGDARIRLVNDDSRFGRREFDLSPDIPPHPPGDWANYLKAAARALARSPGLTRGLDGLVLSTVPVAAGLSSSSALVIALGRALLVANDRTVPTLPFAQAMANAERYTGTQGGGMDQAISAGAKAGNAARIDFDPLRMRHIPVPEGWRFVVAHSLVAAEKSGPAQEAYNSRGRECREALVRLQEKIGDRRLSYPGLLGLARPEAESDLALGTRGAPVCPYDAVALGEAHLRGSLQRRFRHVVTEGQRVLDAETALRHDDPVTFGLLMNASHASLRDDYEVSSPELDALVEAALRAGARGARLTGAGFGGCVVALTDEGGVDGIREGLLAEYYRAGELLAGRGGDSSSATAPAAHPGSGPQAPPNPRRSLSQLLFVARPSPGASVHRLDPNGL